MDTSIGARGIGGSGTLRYALVGWALAYGGLRTYWALGHQPDVPPVGADLVGLTGWGAVVACAVAGLFGLASAPRRAPRVLRWAAAVVGALTAVALVGAPLLLLLDVVALLFPGIGIPWSPTGLASRAGCLAGGLLATAVAVSTVRELRGACARCGRGSKPARDGVRWWAWTGAYLAVAGCLTRLVAQAVVGFSGAPDAYEQAAVAGVAFVVAAVAAGTVLPLALVHSWGRTLPAWVPLLGGRLVPRWLLLAPAAFVAVGVTAYFGVSNVQLLLEGAGSSAAESGLPTWFFWVAEPAYLVWGIGLGVAAWSYRLRTRPNCRTCAARVVPDDRPVPVAG